MPRADYPSAIPFWADPTNYRVNAANPNTPKGWCLHTPQEPADTYAYTPVFFADPNRDASTHYFVSYEGKVYQCVAEKDLAIANGIVGRPYPSWADPNRSLNWQSLSVEIEGYAESIGDTLAIGGAQWDALVNLVRDRCDHYGIPLDREHIIGHYEVANNRSDPGAGFPWDQLMEAIVDAPTKAEFGALFALVTELKANIQATFALALRNQSRIDALEKK